MPTLKVVDWDNKEVGTVDAADAVFGAEVNEALLYQAVHHFRNSTRRGTHKTKVRHEVRGSGRKLWRQKGTGRARMGEIRSPLWRKGGTVHGPQPRSYAYHLPKKMLLGALRSALSARVADEAVTVVKDFSLDDHKTKNLADKLAKLGLTGESVLIVSNGDNEELERASRNIPKVDLMSSRQIHPYHVLGHKRVLLSEDVVAKCSEVLR